MVFHSEFDVYSTCVVLAIDNPMKIIITGTKKIPIIQKSPIRSYIFGFFSYGNDTVIIANNDIVPMTPKIVAVNKFESVNNYSIISFPHFHF